MDANKNVYTKSIGKQLTGTDGLAMVEVVGEFTHQPLTATYFRGSSPIDAVWATPNVEVTGACVMPCGYRVGDHQLFIVDFSLSSILGHTPCKILWPAACCLNIRLPNILQKYTSTLENLFQSHRVMEKLEKISANPHLSQDNLHKAINRINTESSNYMRAAKKRCRKIKSGTTIKWIRRHMIYSSLLQLKDGRKKNRSNLLRMAKGAGSPHPLWLSRNELLLGLQVCEVKCKDLRKTGWVLRRQHLHSRCNWVHEDNDLPALGKVLAIIHREQDKAFWTRLRFALGKKRGRSVSSVQVESLHGGVEEFTTGEGVQSANFRKEHQKRFFLVESAPICQGQLKDSLGYLARSQTAVEILNSTFAYPPDFDAAIQDLCIECARIRNIISVNSVSPAISASQWMMEWGRMKEDTSLSESNLHFGHYKAGAHSVPLSQFYSLKSTLLMKRGLVMERWGQSLLVMIEK